MNIIKNIPVEGSNNRLMGTDVFFLQENKHAPVIIYVHGFNGFKDWANFDLMAIQFANAGYCFIKMNLSHNGTTLENPTEFSDPEAFGMNNYSIELFDVQQIINWACNPSNPYADAIDLARVALLGHSRGGGIAILKAFQDERIKALITWASIAECKTPWGTMRKEKMDKWKEDGVMYYTNKRTNQQLPLYYQLYEDYIQHEEALNIEHAIASLKIPVLVCHGTEDPAVPYSSALQLSRWQPRAELFSISSDHVFGRSHPWASPDLPEAMQAVVDRSINFLNKTFGESYHQYILPRNG